MAGWHHGLDGRESELVMNREAWRAADPLEQRVDFSDASVGSQRVGHD